MDILQSGNINISERKRGIPKHYFPPPIEPELDGNEQIVANLSGMDITINEPEYALRIYSMGNFGTFVGQRMNFANLKCFESISPTTSNDNMMDGGGENNDLLTIPTTENSFIASGEARAWINNKMGGGALHLSPMEAFYLFTEIGAIKICGNKLDKNSTVTDVFNLFRSILGQQFVRNYYVYRYFRRLGWIVRDGNTFGVHFLLYKDGVDFHHSRAGVRIVDSSIADPIVTDMAIHAVIRALNSCKKGLLLVAVEIPKTANNIRLDDLEFAKIQVLSMNRWEMNKSRSSDLE